MLGLYNIVITDFTSLRVNGNEIYLIITTYAVRISKVFQRYKLKHFLNEKKDLL